MKAVAYVDAGVCGFEATVTAEVDDPLGKARVGIETGCGNLKKLGELLQPDIMDMMKKGGESEAGRMLNGVVPPSHYPCPVVYAVFQTVKIAAGLAIPKNVTVGLSKQ
jgi:hypothetical protein